MLRPVNGADRVQYPSKRSNILPTFHRYVTSFSPARTGCLSLIATLNIQQGMSFDRIQYFIIQENLKASYLLSTCPNTLDNFPNDTPSRKKFPTRKLIKIE